MPFIFYVRERSVIAFASLQRHTGDSRRCWTQYSGFIYLFSACPCNSTVVFQVVKAINTKHECQCRERFVKNLGNKKKTPKFCQSLSCVLLTIQLTLVMPKIVSKSTVSSSDQQGNNDNNSNNTKLHVYYCLCSEFILVIDHDLQQLPRRQTDKSHIVSNTARTFKLTADQGQTIIIRREEGYEKQHRLLCPSKSLNMRILSLILVTNATFALLGCNLVVAYETTQQRRAGPHTYILEGALSEQQGAYA